MNWVSIDIGTTEVKASVLDKRNTPIRLSYPMSGYYTTRLTTEVIITTDGDIIVGDDATLIGTIKPELLILDWQRHPRKADIYKTLLTYIGNAAREFYKDDILGAIILYNRSEDKVFIETAKKLFSDCKSIRSSENISIAIPELKAGITVIADFGANSFKVSIIERGILKSFTQNTDLGFQSFDMNFLIDFNQFENLTSTEQSLYGIMIQRTKIALNNATPFYNLFKTKAMSHNIKNEYEKCMTTYLYQCFEECLNALQTYSKTWNDVTNILFVGGGANSSIINTVFERYIEGKGSTLRAYNQTNKQLDSQYIATHVALQVPISSTKELAVYGTNIL